MIALQPMEFVRLEWWRIRLVIMAMLAQASRAERKVAAQHGRESFLPRRGCISPLGPRVRMAHLFCGWSLVRSFFRLVSNSRTEGWPAG